MKYLILICAVFVSLFCFSQKQNVYYFDKAGKRINNKDSAEFYRVIDTSYNDNFSFIEHRRDGTWVNASAIGSIDNPEYNGIVSLYYKNGKICERHEYSHGHATKTQRYAENGTLLQTIMYGAIPGLPYTRLIYDSDSLGNVNILNGNGRRTEQGIFEFNNTREVYTWEGAYKNCFRDGVWKGKDNYGIIFEEKYDHDRLVYGESISSDGKKYHYKYMYENAMYNGGFLDIEKYIKHHFTNPADTAGLKENIFHILSLSYDINEQGMLENIYGYKAFDMSPVRLTLNHNPLKVYPAKLRGVPVKSNIAQGSAINTVSQIEQLRNANWVVIKNNSSLFPAGIRDK